MKGRAEIWGRLPRLVRNYFSPVCYFPSEVRASAILDTPGLPIQQWRMHKNCANFIASPLSPIQLSGNPARSVSTLLESHPILTLSSRCLHGQIRAQLHGRMLTHRILQKLTFKQDLSGAWRLQKLQLKWSHNVFSHCLASPTTTIFAKIPHALSYILFYYGNSLANINKHTVSSEGIWKINVARKWVWCLPLFGCCLSLSMRLMRGLKKVHCCAEADS